MSIKSSKLLTVESGSGSAKVSIELLIKEKNASIFLKLSEGYLTLAPSGALSTLTYCLFYQ